MSNINLLPWREVKRARNDRNMLVASGVFWAACIITGLLAMQYINIKLDEQRERNQYLVKENAKLNRIIADIKKLQAEKRNLVGRIEVIQNLQRDRINIVHVFDDIVRKLPEGVTLDRMRKRGRVIHLNGRAQSNSRVSELMNKVDTSQYFGRSNLNVVSLRDSDNNDIREFEVVLTEVFKKKPPAKKAAPTKKPAKAKKKNTS
jgi:type IV pilus assembly protein PilN